MRVSYLILTYNRKHDLQRCLDSVINQNWDDLEIVVVDNNSEDGTDQMVTNKYPQVQYVRVDYNSGVCQGRNIGFEAATGDVIVVIDDDGELPDNNVTEAIAKGFQEHPQMGIMALKVLNPADPATRRVIPSTDKSIADLQTDMEVAYFLGGGVAIRREVLDAVGTYPAAYFYSMEELDLSYRLAKTQWRIRYFPQITVLHHESVGQRPSWRRYYYDYRNRIWLTTSFLPLRYLVVNLGLWGVKLGLGALRHGHFKSFLKGARDGVKGLSPYKQRRKQLKLKPQEVKRIRNLSGRLYY
ncbi:MAG: glycosyltransferase family 2 protein [Firmicutes bacterium]|nr:glycosyltransferase family 2 protein [Bacillota bacterium]